MNDNRPTGSGATYRCGAIGIDAVLRQVSIDGVPAKLGGRAFAVLLALVERRQRVVSKQELMDLVWPKLVVEENNLLVHMVALRKLLGPHAITTIPGRGYCFSLPIDAVNGGGLDQSSAPLAVMRGNLAASPPLLGRAQDLDAVNALLREHAVVSIVGAAGIGKTRLALELARRLRCKLVLASTSDVYGRNPELPFSEAGSDHVIGNSKSPRWAYAVSKLFDEHLALAYQDAYGFPVTILRFFGSYGPRQPLSWWGGPPPVFIECVLTGRPVPIHGDGSQTRSFTFVTDTVEGIYQATVRPEANGEIINIGSTQEITILELAKRVKRASGTPGELQVEFVPYASFTGRKYEDVMRRVPDVALCARLLGVRAQVSIDDGLARTIAWQRDAMAKRAVG